MRSSYLCSPCPKILGINCFNPGQHSLVCPQLTLHPAIASDRSSCIGMVPTWCACHLGPWVLTQCHLATHSALIKTTRNALYIHIHMYIYMYIYNYIYISKTFALKSLGSLVALIPRKRTMLITTAPWLLVLGKVVMTPERRLVGVVVNYICSLAVPLSDTFGVLSLCGICCSCRADLEKIKKYKGIRMVRRYRDKLNKRRVAGDSAFNYNGFTMSFWVHFHFNHCSNTLEFDACCFHDVSICLC